jgi:hypothetical protein
MRLKMREDGDSAVSRGQGLGTVGLKKLRRENGLQNLLGRTTYFQRMKRMRRRAVGVFSTTL